MENSNLRITQCQKVFNPEHPHMAMKYRNFTLLELLIVIAIIMILASVLLPSLSKARSVTQRIACTNILKQISTGTQMYVQDYNDCPAEVCTAAAAALFIGLNMLVTILAVANHISNVPLKMLLSGPILANFSITHIMA